MVATAAVVGVALMLPAAGAAQTPETTITSGPEGPTGDPAPSFSFSSDQANPSFECRLDGGTWTLSGPPAVATGAHVFNPGWERCTAPHTYEHVDDGSHGFEVRATSPSGETDPTPATRSFELDTRVLGDLDAKETQRQPRRRIRIELGARAEEQLTIKVRGAVVVRRSGRKGNVRHALAQRTLRLAAGQSRVLRLRLEPGAAGARTVAALRRGRTVTAAVSATLVNALGHSLPRRLSVELKVAAG